MCCVFFFDSYLGKSRDYSAFSPSGQENLRFLMPGINIKNSKRCAVLTDGSAPFANSILTLEL